MASSSRRLCLVMVLAAGALSACGGSGGGSNGPATAGISYLASTSSSPAVVFDSVTYDDGHGTLIKVNAPGTTWTKTFSTTIPASAEAHLYGHSTGAGSARLVVNWSTGSANAGDSTTATIPGATAHWHADIPHHAI